MSSVNKVTLIGNICRDPEVRRMNSGSSVVSFSLATNERWKDRDSGEVRDKAEFHNIVIFNEHIGKVAEQYCKKGSKVYLEGQLQTRKYTDKDGNERQTTEIVLQRFRGELTLLDGKPQSDAQDRDPPNRTHAFPRDKPAQAGRMADAIDDDLPF